MWEFLMAIGPWEKNIYIRMYIVVIRPKRNGLAPYITRRDEWNAIVYRDKRDLIVQQKRYYYIYTVYIYTHIP